MSLASDRSEHIFDLLIKVRLIDGTLKTVTAYGPAKSKSVARWGLYRGATFTHKNVDNVGLYIHSHYVQERVLNGIYPHLPISPLPPTSIWTPGQPLPPSVMVGDWLLLHANGTATILDGSDEDGQCGSDDLGPADEMELTYNNLAMRDLFPGDYLAQYDAWVAA